MYMYILYADYWNCDDGIHYSLRNAEHLLYAPIFHQIFYTVTNAVVVSRSNIETILNH